MRAAWETLCRCIILQRTLPELCSCAEPDEGYNCDRLSRAMTSEAPRDRNVRQSDAMTINDRDAMSAYDSATTNRPGPPHL